MATIKQTKAFAEVGVNGGNISQAMKTAGYGKSVSKRTDKLTSTKGWEELMKKYLPDSLIGAKHKALLEKTEMQTVPDGIDPNTRQPKFKVIEAPETQAVSKALDMAYKLKGRYAKDGDGATNNQVVIVNISQEISSKYGQPSVPNPTTE